MYPEVKEFFESHRDSDEYYRAQAEVQNAHPVPRWSDRFTAEERAAFYKAERERQDATLTFQHEMREKHITSLEALKNHSDPVVKWLASDRVIARDYTGYRDQVLKALPMDREHIDSFGDRQGWCGDYARMLERAEKANVLPAQTPDLANIDDLVRELVGYWGGSSSRFRNTIRSHMPKIIESYEALKAEREAAEKAAAEKAVAEAETAEKVALLKDAVTVAPESAQIHIGVTWDGRRDATMRRALSADRPRTPDGRFAPVSV